MTARSSRTRASWVEPIAKPGANPAFLWNGTGLQNLGNFGTDTSGRGYSSGQALNDVGHVTGYSHVYDADGVSRGYSAFLWNGTALQNLGNFGTDTNGYGYSSAQAISASGQVVGRSSVDSNGDGYLDRTAAFLYDNGSLFNLSDLIGLPSNIVLSDALAINDAGQILGRGNNLSTGSQFAFLLTPQSVAVPDPGSPVPVPGSLLLMGAGLLAAGVTRWQRKT